MVLEIVLMELGGTITSNAVGIYLKDTGANKITAGTLNIASGGVGVFGENAKILWKSHTQFSLKLVHISTAVIH